MGTQSTWADVSRVKKLAKSAKKSDPSLSYNQHLDGFAQSECGVRHFHELNERWYAGVKSHVRANGDGASHCEYCGLNFVDSLKADIKAHRRVHSQYEMAEAAFGFLPLKYGRRERIKRLGYSWLDSPDTHTKREGGLLVLLSHFERSLDSAIINGHWQHHPNFREYVVHALQSTSFLPTDVRTNLVAEFGSVAKHADVSTTYWPSPEQAKQADAVASSKMRNSLLQRVLSQETVDLP